MFNIIINKFLLIGLEKNVSSPIVEQVVHRSYDNDY